MYLGDIMEYVFNTKGTCSMQIKFDINDGVITEGDNMLSENAWF